MEDWGVSKHQKSFTKMWFVDLECQLCGLNLIQSDMLLINFALQSKVCQVLFNCGDRDMQISELICFISSLSMLGVL